MNVMFRQMPGVMPVGMPATPVAPAQTAMQSPVPSPAFGHDEVQFGKAITARRVAIAGAVLAVPALLVGGAAIDHFWLTPDAPTEVNSAVYLDAGAGRVDIIVDGDGNYTLVNKDGTKKDGIEGCSATSKGEVMVKINGEETMLYKIVADLEHSDFSYALVNKTGKVVARIQGPPQDIAKMLTNMQKAANVGCFEFPVPDDDGEKTPGSNPSGK